MSTRRIYIRYFHVDTRKRCRLQGYLPFTVYGHRFCVTKIPYPFPRMFEYRVYSITHLRTGMKMGGCGEPTKEKAKRAGIRQLHKIGRPKCLREFKKLENELIKEGLLA